MPDEPIYPDDPIARSIKAAEEGRDLLTEEAMFLLAGPMFRQGRVFVGGGRDGTLHVHRRAGNDYICGGKARSWHRIDQLAPQELERDRIAAAGKEWRACAACGQQLRAWLDAARQDDSP